MTDHNPFDLAPGETPVQHVPGELLQLLRVRSEGRCEVSWGRGHVCRNPADDVHLRLSDGADLLLSVSDLTNLLHVCDVCASTINWAPARAERAGVTVHGRVVRGEDDGLVYFGPSDEYAGRWPR